MRASESIVGVNLASTVSCDAPHPFDEVPASHAFAVSAPDQKRYRVVAYDCGAKKSILHNLVRVGCDLTVVPWDTPAEKTSSRSIPTVCSSRTGPGHPEAVEVRTPRSRSCSERCRYSASVWGIR